MSESHNIKEGNLRMNLKENGKGIWMNERFITMLEKLTDAATKIVDANIDQRANQKLSSSDS